jgi:hypothetical protein
MKQWAFQVLIAIDQLFNALLAGWSDETLSARAARMRDKGQRFWGWTANAIDLLFFWQKNPGHCDRALYAERVRSQLPPSLRGSPVQPSYWDDEWQS